LDIVSETPFPKIMIPTTTERNFFNLFWVIVY